MEGKNEKKVKQTFKPDATVASPKGKDATVKEKPVKTFLCPCCNICYATPEEMIAHVKAFPITLKTHTCSICRLDFYVRGDLLDHQRLDHQMAVGKQFKCNECSLEYCSRQQLVRHKMMHEEIAQKLAACGIFLPRPGAEQALEQALQPSQDSEAEWSKSVGEDVQRPCEIANKTLHSDSSFRTAQVSIVDQRCLSPKIHCAEQDFNKSVINREADTAKSMESKLQETDDDDYDDEVREDNVTSSPDSWECVSVADTVLNKQKAKPIKFRCDLCGEVFLRSLLLNRHVKTHTVLVGQIESCSRDSAGENEDSSGIENKMKRGRNIFAREENRTIEPKQRGRGRPRKVKNGCVQGNRLKHYKILKREYQAITCKVCGKECSRPCDLRNHMKTHKDAPLEKFECNYCAMIFDRRCDFDRHIIKHTHARNFVCEYCQKAFSSRDHLRIHMRIHTQEKRYKCKMEGCEMAFVQFMQLKTHMLVHTQDRTYACEICDKIFPCASYLKQHMHRHTQEKPFCCTTCGSCFSMKSSLKLHERKHLGLRLFVCEVCSKSFIALGDLKKHLRIHNNERRYICEVCGEAFLYSAKLTLHMVVHTGNATYQCETCHKAFPCKSSLKFHARSHSGVRPIICPVCGKGFTRASHMRTHQLNHSESKPFVCSVCSKSFATADNLKRHNDTHTGVKKFSCNVCSRAFAQASNLKNHMMIHTGHRPWVCHLCGKSFIQNSNLKTHMKLHASFSSQKHKAVLWHEQEQLDIIYQQVTASQSQPLAHPEAPPHGQEGPVDLHAGPWSFYPA